MINCKTLIIFTTIVFLSAESRPFGDLLRALISGHLLHPHTRTVDHHHYYTDDIHRRNDLVHAPHYHHYDMHHPHLHPPHGELLHRVHSDRQPAVICCRVNPLQPYYKQPAAPSGHHVEGHLDHHGHVQGVNNHASGLHTSVIYHGHIGDHQSPPHHHHHQMIDCDKLHKKEHDEKYHDGHDDKHQGGDDDKHHNDQSGEHHKEHYEHHEDHSVEHHDKHHHEDHHSHEDHSDEHHNDDHHEDNTPAIHDSKIDEKPSYEVFENVSDVPKESFSKSNVNEINKKSEDNIVFS